MSDKKSATSAEKQDGAAYDVGYGKPPRATQFKPGRSGNPKGRAKGARNFASIVTAALNERVTVIENGKRRRITKLEAAMKQLTNRAATGEPRATQTLLALAQAAEIQTDSPAPASSVADDIVMRELVRRIRGDQTS
jgi:hypothetical protein